MITSQKTLKTRIKCSGVGLHSGQPVMMTLLPAAPDTGIVFRRTDLPGHPTVSARHDRVTDLKLCTSIGDRSSGGNGASVGTIEHLVAAFAGLGVDNVVVELDGPEVPVMDGSAAPFVFLLECANLIEQVAPRRYIEVLKPVVVEDGSRRAALYPAQDFMISFAIDFDHPLVGKQSCSFRVDPESFKAELAQARTFGFMREVETLRAMGLARGGSLENAVVIGDDGVINEDGLRFPNEFVRHKALDAVGDLYLAGAPLLAHFHGERAGHALNNQLLAALFADSTAWRQTTRRSYSSAPVMNRVPAAAAGT